MPQVDTHISDEDLIRAADGELAAVNATRVRKHLAACWTCRTRLRELEDAIARFIQAERSGTPLPPLETSRAVLQARMREMAAAAPARRSFFSHWARLAPACPFVVIVVAAAALLHTAMSENSIQRVEARVIPDASLTPGATLPVSRNDVCADGTADTVRLVPTPVARKVFEAYGIHQPRPRDYELDYLITPALGGADNIRNFWPQPYGAAVWNAHIKDALEDHLHRLVCAGQLDLSAAQRDISRDWVAAYKKYFDTETPLPQHTSFLKDRPWE